MKFPNDLRLDHQSAVKLTRLDQWVKSFAKASKPVKMKGEFKQPGHWPLNTTGAASRLESPIAIFSQFRKHQAKSGMGPNKSD